SWASWPGRIIISRGPDAPVRRALLLLALLAAYLAVGLRPVAGELVQRGRYDPFLPAARALEHRVEEGRFVEALPLALDLRRSFRSEPEVALLLARVHHGLGDPVNEASAWETYVTLSSTPAEACPALTEAYARAGRRDAAQTASARCDDFERRDPLSGSDRP